MEDYQQRVVDERAELDGKISKLVSFIDSVQFLKLDATDQFFLKKQLRVMNEYSDILRSRISRFKH